MYANVFRRGRTNEQQEVRVSKATTFLLGICAILLGLTFEKQNVAFMVGLAFAIAASGNFPVLLMSMYWRGFTTKYWRGFTTKAAVLGGWLGLASAVILTVLSPAIWVKTIGFHVAVFPYDAPALFSMPLGFLGCWLGSVLDRGRSARAEEAAFEAQYVRSQTGIGVEGAAAH